MLEITITNLSMFAILGRIKEFFLGKIFSIKQALFSV
jgi:hypothetical protein